MGKKERVDYDGLIRTSKNSNYPNRLLLPGKADGLPGLLDHLNKNLNQYQTKILDYGSVLIGDVTIKHAYSESPGNPPESYLITFGHHQWEIYSNFEVSGFDSKSDFIDWYPFITEKELKWKYPIQFDPRSYNSVMVEEGVKERLWNEVKKIYEEVYKRQDSNTKRQELKHATIKLEHKTAKHVFDRFKNMFNKSKGE